MKEVKLFMDEKEKDDLFYVCILLEYIARKTANRRSDVIAYFDKDDINRELCMADINKDMTFDAVASGLILDYGIPRGRFDTVRSCKFTVPSVISIGRVYQELILAVHEPEYEIEQTLIEVFSSFLSDEIADFNANVYYSSPEYLRRCYLEGELLA